jgi:hypothetical protein
MLTEVAGEFPRSMLRVLCGDTHGEGGYSHGKIVVDTGGATYAGPRSMRYCSFKRGERRGALRVRYQALLCFLYAAATGECSHSYRRDHRKRI